MARYIKANPKVAQFLRLDNDRNQIKDGNYLLWQSDMLAFGRLTELPQILEQIGGIVLQAHEARQEQDGTEVRELPTATDSRFVVEKEEATEQTETTEQEQTEDTETGGTETEPTPEETGESETETTNKETEQL
ncbi:hypothetical protein [uncultured Bacteroides sp.]|uniref:hypothetical protein n=1 Tax=uncultured Bacteroides sp. TaxID=162156 RepID=UPI0025F69599|nr:hypothetical protein [uncultured Bacteroides sp.]